MKMHTEQHPLEIRAAMVARGFRGIEDRSLNLVFKEGRFLPEEVVTRLQRGVDAFAKVRDAEASLQLARADRDRQMPGLKLFAEEAVLVAARHFGGDAEKMATFGVVKSRTAKPRIGSGTQKHQHPPAKPRGECRCPEDEVVTAVIEEVVIVDEPRKAKRPRARVPRAKPNGTRR